MKCVFYGPNFARIARDVVVSCEASLRARCESEFRPLMFRSTVAGLGWNGGSIRRRMGDV